MNENKLIQGESDDWECELFGCGKAITLRPTKGHAPNMFWRTMQYIILGNKWVFNPIKK